MSLHLDEQIWSPAKLDDLRAEVIEARFSRIERRVNGDPSIRPSSNSFSLRNDGSWCKLRCCFNFARVGKATEAKKDRGKVRKQNRRKVVVPKRRDIQD